MSSEMTPDRLPRPPRIEPDGTIDVYVEFSGYGPAGPGFYLVSLTELLDDGGSHLWPRLVWDGDDWVRPDDAWFAQYFPASRGARLHWGLDA